MYRCLLGLVTAELSAQEIPRRVAPSVPMVDTGHSTGSGVLVGGGYVVTSYHVVHSHDEARLVFPDGSAFDAVPVVGYDFMADIAVLRPIEHGALELSDGEGLPPGSALFLVGHPAEYRAIPQTSITAGVLSRVRHWDTYDLTVLAADAVIGHGQSGGALVDGNGEVVGITTWGKDGFAYAVSGADAALIVRELIAAADGPRVRRSVSKVGELTVDPDDGTELVTDNPESSDIHFGLFDYEGDVDWYTFEAEAGDLLAVSVDAITADTVLTVFGPHGEVVAEGDDFGPVNTVLGNLLNGRLVVAQEAAAEAR